MFTINSNNNIELRNIQEQVQKNKEDIANHYAIDRAMSNLGIKVVGQVDNAELLPDPATYSGEYGDTYAVGLKSEVQAGTATYDYYVFTRPDLNAGQPNKYWLNVGKISIAGPIGPEGPEGPIGPAGKSSRWYTGEYQPENPNIGDMYLNNQGQVFQYTADEMWVPTSNIKGPQGIQGKQGNPGPQGEKGDTGPKGEKGDVGGFINIVGVVDNTNLLPPPSTLDDLTKAYLVGAGVPYTLYVQVGEDSESSVWTNVGDLNAATYVTSGGQYQNVWDADTKMDMPTNSQLTGSFSVPLAYKGNPVTIIWRGVSSGGNYGQVPLYGDTNQGDTSPTGTGRLLVPDPTQPYQAASKNYVDNGLSGKVGFTDYATAWAYGIVKPYQAQDESGIAVYEGQLYNISANYDKINAREQMAYGSDIAFRANKSLTIAPSNIDYAVKKCLTSPAPISTVGRGQDLLTVGYTEDEQKAAKTTLGIAQYTHNLHMEAQTSVGTAYIFATIRSKQSEALTVDDVLTYYNTNTAFDSSLSDPYPTIFAVNGYIITTNERYIINALNVRWAGTGWKLLATDKDGQAHPQLITNTSTLTIVNDTVIQD